jgi:hypothetical protein
MAAHAGLCAKFSRFDIAGRLGARTEKQANGRYQRMEKRSHVVVSWKSAKKG